MINPKFCPYCGTATVEGAQFCGGCGSAIRTPSAPYAPNTQSLMPPPAVFAPAPLTALAPPAPARRGGIGKKAVVLVMVAFLLVGAVGVYAVAFRGGNSPSTVLPYVPGNSVAFAEARLDLPGDQKVNLAAFLLHFPIFGNGSGSTGGAGGLDKLLDQLFTGSAAATPAPLPGETPVPGQTHQPNYSNDIRPWFGGDVAVSVAPANPDVAPVLVLVSVTDPAKAMAWWQSKFAYGDTVPTHQTYGGVDLLVLPWDTVAGVVGGKVMLVGNAEAVHAAIDAPKAGGLAANPSFVKARAALSGDSVAAAFIDVRALATWLPSELANRGSSASSIATLASALDNGPDWFAFRLRAEPSAIVLDAADQPAAGAAKRANAADTITSNLPANTIAVYDVHDLGAIIQSQLDVLRTDNTVSASIDQIDNALGQFGGLSSLLGQIGTMDAVATWDGSRLTTGIVAESKDPAATQQLITSIASQAGASGFGVNYETHAGTEITVIDPYASVSAVPLIGQLTLQLALKGNVLVAGVGDGFVASVLDAPTTGSLASDPRYKAAIGRVGATNTVACYFDVTAIREIAEQQASQYGGLGGSYEDKVQPWLLPFDTLACATVVGDTVDHSVFIATVK